MLASRSSKWSAGTVLACVVLLAVTWFLLIAPRRAQAADTQDQQVAAQQSNDLLRTQIAQLQAEFADLPKTQAELTKLRAQLAPTVDMSGLLRQITAVSSAAGTDLLSISPSAPTLLSAASSGSAGSAGSQVVTGPVAGTAGGVAQIPVSLLAGGDYYQVVGFLRALQTQMPRALLITGLQLDQDSSYGQDGVKLSLTADVFSLADTSSDSSSASPSASTPGSSAVSAASSVASSAAAPAAASAGNGAQ